MTNIDAIEDRLGELIAAAQERPDLPDLAAALSAGRPAILAAADGAELGKPRGEVPRSHYPMD